MAIVPGGVHPGKKFGPVVFRGIQFSIGVDPTHVISTKPFGMQFLFTKSQQ